MAEPQQDVPAAIEGVSDQQIAAIVKQTGLPEAEVRKQLATAVLRHDDMTVAMDNLARDVEMFRALFNARFQQPKNALAPENQQSAGLVAAPAETADSKHLAEAFDALKAVVDADFKLVSAIPLEREEQRKQKEDLLRAVLEQRIQKQEAKGEPIGFQAGNDSAPKSTGRHAKP
jgi:hypothetical protein